MEFLQQQKTRPYFLQDFGNGWEEKKRKSEPLILALGALTSEGGWLPLSGFKRGSKDITRNTKDTIRNTTDITRKTNDTIRNTTHFTRNAKDISGNVKDLTTNTKYITSFHSKNNHQNS